ncbi:MAG: YndJ family transporter [Kofleriaceae bacterium]
MRSHELAASGTWIFSALPGLLIALMTAVITPLSLAAAAAPRLVRRAAWPAGAALALGLLTRAAPGTALALVALPYALVAAAAGAVGVGRLLAGAGGACGFAVAVGLVFVAAAACWLVAACAGYPLLGYPPFWVLLTAAHFHVAGAALLIVVGRVAHGRGPAARVIAVACALAVPLTAAGIHGPRWLEVLAALGTAASAAGAGVLLVTWRAPRRRWLARAAGAALLTTMPLAAAFALRDHGAAVTVLGLDPLASMLVAHGAVNTIVFAGLALVALATTADPASWRTAPPLSRLAGGAHIGAEFLARRGLERASAPAPRGLVDELADLDHPGLDAAKVAPAIRAFYERTAEHEMLVRPAWRRGFRLAARAWARVARRLGQLQLPVRDEATGAELRSRIVAVDAEADGRRAPRSWIRTFPDGRALYVAVYASHRRGGRAYMNIAFPLPGGNLTSILRVDHLGDGVTVSTRRGGDCGIWLVARLFGRSIPLRLPLSETIDVWCAEDPAALAGDGDGDRAWMVGFSTVARHRFWIFGIPYLTLRYAMRLRDA